MTAWLGIDFSGNHLQWRYGCRTSNVWIAELRANHGELSLRRLYRVQELPGSSPPFLRLVQFSRQGRFVAIGIDASFSLPEAFLPVGGHQALLRGFSGPPPDSRLFVSAERFLAQVAPALSPPGK